MCGIARVILLRFSRVASSPTTLSWLCEDMVVKFLYFQKQKAVSGARRHGQIFRCCSWCLQEFLAVGAVDCAGGDVAAEHGNQDDFMKPRLLFRSRVNRE
mmetsp:Transcript_124303/g.202057  ORF Transcript_124303/g.202057 Transcript_124303/m.202057 type:complete len:100 (+) Transcript_124303:299-598(+)